MTAKLFLQYALMFLLVLVDAAMFWFLAAGLVVGPGETPLDPAIAALVGSLAGAITTSIGLGAKDLFTLEDNRPPIPPG